MPTLSPQRVVEVTRTVEPVAEALCRAETPDQICDFRILIDTDPRNGANAFQTSDRSGQPLILMTAALLARMEGPDELAFVIGHEAGHHIARHRDRQAQSAAEGARILGGIAAAQGADRRTVIEAAELGAFVGTRRYSQAAELEADAIGTLIAWRAGFDPVAGAQIFSRLPDPGVAFLATHPPNAERAAVVQRTFAQLQAP
ncbi:M48 family metalloprotease [Roseicyclus elongatus]|uniref:M48 family metalloprotease n=1 Tax=Roseicyclus elongatus TaxID=159346 RepID=UPI001FDF6B97|nr:M48 family metalloprotease [Roseibacterium elongatum]